MEEKGIVCEVKDEYIKLLMKSSEGCDNCSACSVDGGPQNRVLTINERVECELGDIVTIDVNPVSPYIGIFSFFILPLILILVFYSIANNYLPKLLNHRDILTVLSAIGGLVLSFPIIKFIDKFLTRFEKKLMHVKKVEKRSV